MMIDIQVFGWEQEWGRGAACRSKTY